MIVGSPEKLLDRFIMVYCFMFVPFLFLLNIAYFFERCTPFLDMASTGTGGKTFIFPTNVVGSPGDEMKNWNGEWMICDMHL